MRLLYSFIYMFVLIASANAEYKMLSTNAGTFLYDTKSGEVFMYEDGEILLNDEHKYKFSGFHTVNFYNPVDRSITGSAQEYIKKDSKHPK